MKKHIYSYLILGGAAAASGYICGLIGSGGGMLLLLAMTFLNNKCGLGLGDTKDIYAQNIAAVASMSMVSAVFYAFCGKLPFIDTLIYLLPAAAGGLCGALLLDKIKIKYLNKILAAVTIYAGYKMLTR